MTPPAPTRPHVVARVRVRPLGDGKWWREFTAPLLAFIASGPTRTWTEIVAWGFARGLVDVQKQRKGTCELMSQMVAWLELDRQIEDVRYGQRDQDALWAVRTDDGSRECRHARLTCESCAWAAGFPAGKQPKDRVCA